MISKYISLVKTDIKNILRDYSLVMMLFVPIFMVLILRYGYPLLLVAAPVVADYTSLLLCMLAILSGAMPGMAMAFVILDEKDNALLSALMVMPIPIKKLMLTRLLVVYLYALLSSFIVIAFSGQWNDSFFALALLSFLAASPSAVFVLLPSFLAANKIEGASIAKALNFLLVLPLPAFVFTGWWTNLLMVVPSWWIYRAFLSIGEPFAFSLAVGAGLAYHALIIRVFSGIVFRKLIYY